jgi:hypothetical protein
MAKIAIENNPSVERLKELGVAKCGIWKKGVSCHSKITWL